jgi:hypothetical protein
MSNDYRLPGREQQQQSADATAFYELRGLLKEALQALGGGEAFLQYERVGFYRAEPAEEK